jgi:hypothetical protein
MKKEYIAPETITVQLDIHGMLAASPPTWGGELNSRELDGLFVEDDFGLEQLIEGF